MRQYVFVFILLVLGLSGCVGTVNDANPLTTHAQDSSNENQTIKYDGISSASPIANDKIEIFFPPASVDASKIAYVVRYDGLQVPIFVSALGLKPDYRGKLKYTVTGLLPDTLYSFNVQVIDLETGVESQCTEAKQAKTFANNTANFLGVSEVRHLQGAAGTRGVEVFWNPAQVKGTIVSKNEIDPIEYQLTLIDGAELNPGNMNDNSFPNSVRRVISVNPSNRSSVITGLKAEHKYYVQARAINYGYLANSGNTNYKVEQNTKYLEITTYSDDLGEIVFDSTLYNLSLPAGNSGFYSILANWGAPTGNFDHFRFYYAESGSADLSDYLNTQDVDTACQGSETLNPNISCVSVEATKSNKLLTGLKPNVQYDIALVVCASTGCEKLKRLTGGILSKKTTPAVASFQGISSISYAQSLDEIDRIYLHFELPNFLSGGINGYLIRYFGSDPSNPDYVDINDPMATNNTGLVVHPYDVLKDTEIAISGINSASTDSYCFVMIPFSYNNDGTKNLGDISGVTPKCVVPTIMGPTDSEFPGIKAIFCDPIDRTLEIKWDLPAKGVYSNFELFYESTYEQFLFGQAIEWQTNNYERILINPSSTSYTIFDLPGPATYWVGMLTFYNSIYGPVRSKFNTNYFSCHIN